MNTAIIVAAGSGSRFSSDLPKQFSILAGKPVIAHTIEKFENSPSIDAIVVVCAGEHVETTQTIVTDADFAKVSHVIAGGTTRAASVACGLRAVDAHSEIVCIHDGVRPLVTVDEIERTIKSAFENGAACLTAAVTDTIKQVEYEKITATVDRGKLRRALTPQAFRYDIIKDSLRHADPCQAATDESSLVEKSGVMVSIVEGSTRNIKITYPDDLIIAEALIAGGQK